MATMVPGHNGLCTMCGGFACGTGLHRGTHNETPLLTWLKGDSISWSHCLSRSEERTALILDTINTTHTHTNASEGIQSKAHWVAWTTSTIRPHPWVVAT